MATEVWEIFCKGDIDLWCGTVRRGLVRFGESWWGMVWFGLPPNTNFFMVWSGNVITGWVSYGLVSFQIWELKLQNFINANNS